MTEIFILKMNFEHIDACSFWEGGLCDCQQEMLDAREIDHCAECNFINSYTGEAPCNCKGRCLYPDEDHGECLLLI